MKSIIFLIYIFTVLQVAAQENINKRPPIKLQVSKPKTVLLGYYFNNEYQQNAAGKTAPFHYTWEDTEDSGFSQLGAVFKKQGVKIKKMSNAPPQQDLSKAVVYIVVYPDTQSETTKPNYIIQTYTPTTYQWVKNDDVSLLLMNDSCKADFTNTNLLEAKYAIQYMPNILNKQTAYNFEIAVIRIQLKCNIFTTTKNDKLKL